MILNGLTSPEAEQRLQKFGPNTMPEEKENPVLLFLQKFWAPVPWMLELIILIELFLKKFTEAWVIAILLLFNALISFLEEGKARNAVRLLQSKLKVQARVLRDQQWRLIPAQELVPDDVICLRMGDIVPADAKLLSGKVSIDQSAITGESLPVEPSIVYAGSIVRQGEAYAKVTETGKNTFFGKTAEIMRTAKTPSHLQSTIFAIVKSLVIFDIILILILLIYSFYQGISLFDTVPFSLLLLIASVPVALPATYALSTALGSMELAKRGVLVTRLSAIEEAAAMNILCIDKTGTITQNSLHIAALRSYAPFTDQDLLCLATMACEEATQDPFDLTILSAAKEVKSPYSTAERIRFLPFDPNRKHSGTIVRYRDQELFIFKGSPFILAEMAGVDLLHDVKELSSGGSRLLGIIIGQKGHFQFVGLLAFQDPPRATSKAAIEELHTLGIRVMMLTGDNRITAKSIAGQVGIGTRTFSREDIHELSKEDIEKTDIFSGIFPEDKFHIVQLLQNSGYISGMTGDGVNDAPALKKAEVGIAVSNATDVAKAAASLVLTNPGLGDIVEAVKESRRIYQRMLTYIQNKIIKTLEISVLLGLGLMLTGQFIISQLLILLLFFINDFTTMTIATDWVSFSHTPDKWNIKRLITTAGLFAIMILGFSFLVLFMAIHYLSMPQVQTMVFLTLVFTGQATLYLVRESKHFWHSRPSNWMLIFTGLDIIFVTILACKGILMAQIPLSLVFLLLGSTAVYFFFLDLLKFKIIKLFKDSQTT